MRSVASPPGWCAPFCGHPFELGADGPDSYDCWGVVRACLRDRFHVDVPALTTLRAQDEATQLAEGGVDWIEISAESARPGDVLRFRGRGGSVHVGLVVAGGWMLHAFPKTTSRVERYRCQPWESSLRGAYRHVELAS